ncbi:MAG: hypothetical protein EBU00_06290 [Alphaproteobacteria bacterium]|nr:hypothetical protein [Alphaproteobacteria bacterium]
MSIDKTPDQREGEISLTDAVRRARLEVAERSNAVHDLRMAEQSKLEALRDVLKPVLHALPREADLFDHGLVPGDRPRFYVDMIAFVEMSRDRRSFRFLMDSPDGRKLLGESDDVQVMANAVTNYLGRRLVERERAIASALSFESLPEERKPLELEVQKDTITAMPVVTEIVRNERGSSFGSFLIGLALGIIGLYAYLNWDNVVVPHIKVLTEYLGAR